MGRLADWAFPIQRRHFEEARETSLKLAAEEDPNGSRDALALAAAGLALAGCGGQQRRAEPRLTRHDAGRLVSLARGGARRAEPRLRGQA